MPQGHSGFCPGKLHDFSAPVCSGACQGVDYTVVLVIRAHRMWGVPEVLDQLCRGLINGIIIVVHPDFHQVCPVCDVPLGPKLRYCIFHYCKLIVISDCELSSLSKKSSTFAFTCLRKLGTKYDFILYCARPRRLSTRSLSLLIPGIITTHRIL